MLDLSVQLAAAGAAIAVMGTAWVVSLLLRDATVADIAWGICLAAIAWAAVVVGEGDPGRSALAALFVTIWAVRLTLHMGLRQRDGEDRRYRAMRSPHGDEFPRRSLWSVFGVQAVAAWIISLPVQVIATDPDPDALGYLVLLGALVYGGGLAMEAIADFQLDRFKRNPLNERAVLSSGLWRFSRHPNYFGEACVWWGIWLIALETGSGWWTAVGPALLTYLLLRVSGVPLTERKIRERRPGYEQYARTTSAFLPRPPRTSD